MGNSISTLQKIYGDHISNDTLPLPRIIHVETRAKCNGTCHFCPASALIDKRQDVYMPDELINKILDELHDLDYSNRVSFYNNNEPFLDGRIYDIVKMSREKLPKAYLELKSNGRLLSLEKVIRIFNAGLDMLYINDYGDGKIHSKNIQNLVNELKKIRRFKGHFEGDTYFNRIQVNLRKIDAILGTKGGTSPNKVFVGSPMRKVCFRPFEMMTINPQGDVSICSNDFHYAMSKWNVNKMKLIDVWHSADWNDLRVKLLKGDRGCSSECAKCDYVGYTQEMLKEHGLRDDTIDVSLKRIMIKTYNAIHERFQKNE